MNIRERFCRMVIPSLQMIGCVFGFTSIIGSITCNVIVDWKHTATADGSSADNLADILIVYVGLWKECYYNVNGYTHCKWMSEPNHKVPTVLSTCRVLVVVGCGFSILGLGATVLGMQCTSIVGTRRTKFYLAQIGASFFLSAGISFCITSAIYANDIKSSYDPAKIQFLYGRALYLGMVTAALNVLAGICVSSGSCQRKISQKSATSEANSRILSSTNGPKTSVFPRRVTVKPKSDDYYSMEALDRCSDDYETATSLPTSSQSGILRKTPKPSVDIFGGSTGDHDQAIVPLQMTTGSRSRMWQGNSMSSVLINMRDGSSIDDVFRSMATPTVVKTLRQATIRNAPPTNLKSSSSKSKQNETTYV